MKPFVWLGLFAGSVVVAWVVLTPPKAAFTSRISSAPARSISAATQGPDPGTRESRTPSHNSQLPAPVVAGVVRAEFPPAFAEFDRWVEQFKTGSVLATLPRGTALAWKRREQMLELIRAEPRKALALAMSYEQRRALPPEVDRFCEQPVDARGALDVMVAEALGREGAKVFREVRFRNLKYKAFVYGRRLSQGCQADIPLHGIVLDGEMAVAEDPIRLLSAAEARDLARTRPQALRETCAVCGAGANLERDSVAADIGGELACFCSAAHAQLVNQHWTMQEGGIGGWPGPLRATVHSEANDAWTHGEKSLLYVRVNFPDDLTEPISEAEAYDQMVGSSAFYAEGSYDQTWLTATVTPLLTLPQTKAWYSTTGAGELMTDARAAARAAGYDTDNYAWDIICFTSVPGTNFGWAGLAYVHGKGLWLQSETGGASVGVTCHEMGHNYGLLHANFWDTSTNYYTSGIGLGTNVEYGNWYDTMGQASGGANQFNAIFKNFLDWLPDTAVVEVASNGVYRLYPFDVRRRVEGSFYAARVRKDYQRDYWLEFRERFTGNPWLSNGLLLNWSPFGDSGGGSELIDTTPGTTAGRGDAGLVVGRTFSDEAAGVYITPVALGTTGTNQWLEVQVNRGHFAANQPPVVQLEVLATNASPGELVHFHATASDPDGDALAYAWTFDDTTFSTNNLPWTFKTFSPGEHVVRCVVSDMKGGAASANTIVTAGSPTGNRVTGLVLDTEGLPVEGVRVDNSADTNALQYFGGYTDSGGSYVLTGVSGELNLFAFKYGYTFTNLTWTNPLTADSNLLATDFIASALPTVTIDVTSNELPENSSGANHFILKRTGDTATNLTLNLNLSGTATPGTDFTLTPPLARGTNTLDIPPGTNALWVAIRTRNDSLVEGPETVTLTLADDPTNIVGSLGEVTLTIVDDDQPFMPAVSVVTTTPTICEDGTEVGEFVFSRTGSTAGDLTVFYSVSGTAVPGTNYTRFLGVAVIPAGRSSTAVQFLAIDDRRAGPDRTVIATVAPNGAYTGSGAPAQVIIRENDLTTVAIFATRDGAAEPSTPGWFTVKRDGDVSFGLVVSYAVSGSATSSLDFAPLSGEVFIPGGANSADIILMPLRDNLLEGDESVTVALTNTLTYDVGTPGTATLFIRDQQRPYVTIEAADPKASEPGDDFASFEVSRGSVVRGNLQVRLAISGTALNGIDYVPIADSVVIPDGSTSATITVIPFDDLLAEPPEEVILNLVADTNYNLGWPAQARAQIMDEDVSSVPGVGFAFAASSCSENQSPVISVLLSTTSSVPVTVNYRVIGGSAAANDYTLAPGPLTVNGGEWSARLPLSFKDNALAQPDRTIQLALYDPIGATLDGIKIHTCTILDDDTNAVSILATVPTATEAGPAAGKFRISRAGSTAADLAVKFQVTGTASAASDYVPLGTSIVIPAGAAFVDLPLAPVDDATVELPETVVVTLISAPGARIVAPNVATVTIEDNDTNTMPLVTVISTNRPCAVEGGPPGEFVFWRNGTNGALTVSFILSGSAVNGADYLLLTNAVIIPDGQASASLAVTAVDDVVVEGERTVVLDLTAVDKYRVNNPAWALITVQDNDQKVRVDASDFTAAEPGSDAGEFTFTRFGTTNTDLEVHFTVSGTAISGVDYLALSNSIIIPAGSLFAALPVAALDDTLVEGPETLILSLQTDPDYYLDAPNSATLILNDDEPMLTLLATVPETIEGSQTPGIITVIRSGDPKYSFTAHLAIGGTARYGIDYPPFATNIYFSCGVTGVDLLIYPTNELVLEPAEDVQAALLPDPAYTILWPSNAVVTIQDAGTNQRPVITLTSPAASPVFLLGSNVNLILEATVTDDGDTNSLTSWWGKISGPDSLMWGDTNQASTTVSFTNRGIYVLRLTADDGQLQSFVDETIVVGAVELLASNLLHWTFDEGVGTNVLDASGNGNNGVLTASPVWVTNGVLGGALHFEGGNDSVCATNTNSLLDGLKAFSLSFWLKRGGANADQGMVTASDSGTNVTLSFSSRTYASCGQYTNVLEATFATTRGSVRHVSANNIVTDAWQHVALTWSNGLAPALFLDGQPDQPFVHMVSLNGLLTNCPGLIVGQGPPDWPLPFNGQLDDVRVFPRALSSWEVLALASLPPTNYGPVVDAGTNSTFPLSSPGILAGVITDDGRPDPPGTVLATWTNLSGPAPVTMTNTSNLTNYVVFTTSGIYGFRLIADDGQVKTFADVTNTVIEPTRVDVYASVPDAAELGPVAGLFTFYRYGDTNFDLPVFLLIDGIATNGLDYAAVSNQVVFPAGIETLEIVITPFLDHRTEGDQSVIFTIQTNLAYSIGSGEATVTIHDSPYGMWSIDHFTLEELTLPGTSAEAADPDRDGLVNFAEYAANLDPRSPETNSPVLATIEVNPDDGLPHIVFSYHRRLPPTDAGYAAAISTDLQTWYTDAEHIQEIQATDDGNNLTETVTVRVVAPYDTVSNQFLTVRVWLKATGP